MKLTNTAVTRLLKNPGRHGDGNGLYLRVLEGGVAFWSYRYRANGQEREMSLGRCQTSIHPGLSLAEARDKHFELRKRVRVDNADPARDKRGGRGVPTFGQASDAYLAAQEGSWTSARHRAQWRETLADYCAAIRDTPVDRIDTAAVLGVLKPLWSRAPVTAARLRGRIETVVDSARALGHIDENRANPARWRGHLDHLLSKRRSSERGHLAALPYANVPAFMAKLKEARGSTPKALQFAILTAARSGEVIGMQWAEVDLDARVWTAPTSRMKARHEHLVPLSDAAVDLLRGQMKTRRGKHPYVFPGAKPNASLNAIALSMMMRRLARQYTAHGFRSSFRDWAADHGVDFDVAEACLAHKIGDAVTRAYLRTTMIERRRKVMTDWAAFLTGEAESVTVVQFKGKRR